MALRRQIAEADATYDEPHLGVNIRESEENLRGGEARLMENCEYYGGIRIRRGSQRLNSSSYGSFKILGGHKYYYGGANPASKRLIAYNNRICSVSETGVETVLTSGMTASLNTYFATWPITDCAYVSNGTDTLRRYDANIAAFTTIGGTNIPVARTAVVPVLDRMLAITTNGIERTNPRSDNIWSNNSSWATLRAANPGLFTALHPYTTTGSDTIYSGALAFQERAYYLINGSNFGTDVTAASASTGEDVSIKLMDGTVGTASPYSVCTVPGVGTFWFTTDLNVFWLPTGSLTGKYVGDKIQSTGQTPGIESTTASQQSQVWMAYFDHILMLGVPQGSNNYASTQWWLDMRALRDHPDRGPVWYGPMTGQTVGRAWVENQQSDNKIMGGEGSLARGAYVYQLRVPSRFTDAVGSVDNPVTMIYQTPFKSFGTPSREKYVQAVHMDLNGFTGTATLDLLDLDGTLVSGLPVVGV